MWSIVHWGFMYLLAPHPCMHVVASILLSAGAYRLHHKLTRRDILPAIGLFLFYVGFYFDHNLEHFAFQPWWVVATIGLRQREVLIFLGGIMTGVYLLLSSRLAIAAHVVINVGTMLQCRKITFKSRALVHALCVLIYVNDPHLLTVTYTDVLLGVSAALCACIRTTPDWFSLGMVFSSPIALSTFILHALEPNWFQYYKNNHFRRVKHSFYFLFPMAVCILAGTWNLSGVKNLTS